MNPFDPHTVLMHLYPRDRADNMGYAIHPTAIVFLVLLGTGFVVAMMYGMDRVSGFRGRPHEEPRHMSVEQARYMAEVRMRNMEALKEESRRGCGLGRGKRPA
ncbi:hypothetical protein SLS60_002574 [Paraconiothyrium brasiliense]|uniref:Uncharacterized protein n=1 Tax=Paraconiothyrium brasiliense TaxID=300254 RepID=A0ABR3RT91_9PLEO